MYQIPATDKIDMNYLKSEAIGKILAKGLAEVYKVNPQFPIDYYAKWLLNYSKTQQNQENLDSTLKHKEDLKKKQLDLLKLQEQENELTKENENRQLNEEIKFKQEIENQPFHLKFLQDKFCQYLAKKGMTGVYVGYVDHPTRIIGDQEDEDLAHLDTSIPKLINYIGSNQSHQYFMIGKTLSLEQGVTGEVFKEVPPSDDPDNAVQQPKIVTVYIPSVVNEPKMVYFQWPKLGAYFAIPLVYNSCLFDSALDTGIDERLKFRKAQADQLKEREIKESEFAVRIQLAQEANEDIEPIVEELNLIKAEWQDVIEPEFQKQKKEYVVCIDTLGQDKEISIETRQYFEDFVILYAQKWEQKEKQLLSNDIDLMISYFEQVNAKEKSDALNLQEEQSLDQGKFDDLKEREKEYQFEMQSLRLQTIVQQITDASLYNELLLLKQMRVLKYPNILQTLLIYLGYEKQQINYPGTNVLDWEKIKPLINEGLFDKIGQKSHRGPQPEPVQQYAKLGRLTKRLEKTDLESVIEYNVCYGKILKWLQLSLQLRRTDIELRRMKIAEKRQLREKRIADVTKMTEDKEKAFEDFKNGLSPEEQETFVKEDWESTYDNDHPVPEIPEEENDDIDQDWDEQ